MPKRSNGKKRADLAFSSGILVLLIVIICMGILIASFVISSRESKVPPLETEVVTENTDESNDSQTETTTNTSDTAETNDTQTETETTVTTAAQTDATSDNNTDGTGEGRFTEYQDATTLPYSANGTNEYLNDVSFFGDSTTYGLRAYSIFGSKQTPRVWTPSSGTLALFRATTDLQYDSVSGTEISLSEIAAKYKPKYLVITLGVNGISMMDETYFKSEYKKVIDIIKEATPSTKIILQTMYPQSAAYKATDTFNNEAIRRGNGWIHDIAAECGVKFLNSYNYFLDSNGYMDAKYDNGGDGMHFNDTGYLRMLEFVKTHPFTD